jgi:hypothetical protein
MDMSVRITSGIHTSSRKKTVNRRAQNIDRSTAGGTPRKHPERHKKQNETTPSMKFMDPTTEEQFKNRKRKRASHLKGQRMESLLNMLSSHKESRKNEIAAESLSERLREEAVDEPSSYEEFSESDLDTR